MFDFIFVLLFLITGGIDEETISKILKIEDGDHSQEAPPAPAGVGYEDCDSDTEI